MQCHAIKRFVRQHQRPAQGGEKTPEAEQQVGTKCAGLQERSEDGKAEAQGKAEEEVMRAWRAEALPLPMRMQMVYDSFKRGDPHR